MYQTQYVTINEDASNAIELPMTVVGTGQQPVLLVHAFGMDARQFIPFILPLCRQYKFYLPHMRGFGLADSIGIGQFDFIERYASDIRYVINHIHDKHGATALHVAAISMGALVMWAYFSRFGGDAKCSKVSRYLNIDQLPAIHRQSDWRGLYGDKQIEKFGEFKAVLDIALPYLDSDDKDSKQKDGDVKGSIDKKNTDFSHLPFKIKQAITNMAYQFSLSSVSRGLTTQVVRLLRYQPDYKMVLLQDSTWQHQLRCLHAYMTLPYDYRTVLSEVTIPVTLLIGGRSKLYDVDEQLSIADMLPNAKTVVLDNSGHAVPVDAPIAFYQALKEFLKED